MRTHGNGYRNGIGRSVQGSTPSTNAPKRKGYVKVGAIATGRRAIPSDEIIAAVGEMHERGVKMKAICQELHIGKSKADTALSWYLLRKARG